VRLVRGRFPAEPKTVAAVGGGYDLFLSKNTLKKGYLRVAEAVDPRRLSDPGAGDATYRYPPVAPPLSGGRGTLRTRKLTLC
jgi:hypothetical protein